MPLILKLEAMAVNSKDIETLWKQYSEEGVKKGIPVVQFFVNGVPYCTFRNGIRRSPPLMESSIVSWKDFQIL